MSGGGEAREPEPEPREELTLLARSMRLLRASVASGSAGICIIGNASSAILGAWARVDDRVRARTGGKRKVRGTLRGRCAGALRRRCAVSSKHAPSGDETGANAMALDAHATTAATKRNCESERERERGGDAVRDGFASLRVGGAVESCSEARRTALGRRIQAETGGGTELRPGIY